MYCTEDKRGRGISGHFRRNSRAFPSLEAEPNQTEMPENSDGNDRKFLVLVFGAIHAYHRLLI